MCMRTDVTPTKEERKQQQQHQPYRLKSQFGFGPDSSNRIHDVYFLQWSKISEQKNSTNIWFNFFFFLLRERERALVECEHTDAQHIQSRLFQRCGACNIVRFVGAVVIWFSISYWSLCTLYRRLLNIKLHFRATADAACLPVCMLKSNGKLATHWLESTKIRQMNVMFSVHIVCLSLLALLCVRTSCR